MKKNIPNWPIMLIALLALIIPSHVIGIDKVVTIDEPWWVISGSNYYYALTHGDFANTIYDYHPAVTTTWMVTAGMLSYFPEYRGFGQGYFDVRKPKFEYFMKSHGKEVIDLVRNSRLFQTGLLITLAVLGYFLLQMLIDRRAAFLAIALAMNGPFFLGHSRLLNHEGMLAMLVLVSLLGMQVYLNKERKLLYLLISEAAFGLAQLTKSSSIVTVGVVGLMIFIGLFKQDGRPLISRIWEAIKTFMGWMLAAAIVYIVLWPGMWVAPGEMLYGVFGNAFSYAFQGARLDVAGELQPSSFQLATGFSTILLYLQRWWISSTVISWLGLLLALVMAFSKDRDLIYAPVRSTIGYLVLTAALFILMFSVAQGRNAPQYILGSFVALDVVAGIGWVCFLAWIQKRLAVLDRAYISALILFVLAAFQLGSALPYYPYYFTYKNSIVSKPAVYGYGEGMDIAADYLSQKPNAREIRAYVYNGMGTFSFFFPGETLVLKRIYLVEDDFATIASEMQSSDYLVLYTAVQNNLPESVDFLHTLRDVQPEKTIYINGLEYVSIYKISDIPESVYDKLLNGK
ncbi:MAG: glycosyltransferase family 39 protein [Chloroflexi bacterium]|nr:glycosyltransferase family 39 protein [Chloroflexota bacterium]